MSDFDDVLAANRGYADSFEDERLEPVALRGLAILTCIDSRIDPLQMVGMRKGDAKILRNAGARVTDDVLRTLVLATHVLGVTRVLVVPHTHCRMAEQTDDELHDTILARSGMDTRSVEFGTEKDQDGTLRRDLQRIRSYPLLPKDLVVGGAIYDVRSGALTPVDLG